MNKQELRSLVSLMIREIEMLKMHDRLLASNRVDDIIKLVSEVAVQEYKDSITEY